MNDTKVKQQIVDKLNDASTVLVALNSNPSVDELSAALGITLSLNKKGKHATAIFSGAIPPAIEFLEPEKTFEQNVDSLRDFIIALDKEKADHLRYKVVDDMVKIFITPYRTTITDHDLEFSQGDYNVDFVLAIGVQSKENLDRALEAHGAILDEATVVAIGIEQDSNLGSINWNDKNASSYSEMLASLTDALKGDAGLLDEQIATAYLTGLVAATERFSNSKTSSRVMTTAATLMGAGANQQLIATQLEKGDALPAQSVPAADTTEMSVRDAAPVVTEEAVPDAAGALAISHEKEGSIDSVAAQTAEENQDEAAKAAEELARQTAAMHAADQNALAEQTQAELAQHLAETTQLPTVSPPGMGFEETPLRGAVPMEQWKAPEPTLGGTLNATTEEAAAEKQREALDDRNRTILSHDSGHYLADQPSFQAPMSAAVDPSHGDEEALPDVFGPNPTTPELPPVDSGLDASPAPTLQGLPVMQPLAGSGPTLAQIDANNRGHEPTGGLPTLPPLPPMPDFSTLPPLPTDMMQTPPATPIDGQPLGSILPPAPTTDPGKSDPAQFQIPGQQ